MHMRIKAGALGAAAVLIVAAVFSSGFLGLAQPSVSAARPIAPFTRSATSVYLSTVSSASFLGAPSGCPDGAVCFYRQGNGGISAASGTAMRRTWVTAQTSGHPGLSTTMEANAICARTCSCSSTPTMEARLTAFAEATISYTQSRTTLAQRGTGTARPWPIDRGYLMALSGRPRRTRPRPARRQCHRPGSAGLRS
jgi:hypothetical protein